MSEEGGAPAPETDRADDAPEPTGPGARELLLRAGLATVVGAAAGLAFVALAGEMRSWVFFLFIGLFLGGLTGLAGFAERRGGGRGWPAQLGLGLALFVAAFAWGTASIFQAAWTQAALSVGLDAAGAELERFLGQVADRPEPLLRIFGPLAALVAAPAVVRMRAGRWPAHAAVGGLTLGAGWLAADEYKFRELVVVLGGGLLLAGWASAWGAAVLARRWWPSPPGA